MLSIVASGCLCCGAEGRFCLCVKPRQPCLYGCSLKTLIRFFWHYKETLVFAFQTVLGDLSVRRSKKKTCTHTGSFLGFSTDWCKVISSFCSFSVLGYNQSRLNACNRFFLSLLLLFFSKGQILASDAASKKTTLFFAAEQILTCVSIN